MDKINHAIGCEVSGCMYNCEGKNCTLDRIVVGHTRNCDPASRTSSEKHRKREPPG